MGDPFEHRDATRALQASESARRHTLDLMTLWTAYSLLKITPRGAAVREVRGYVTNLPALSGHSPHAAEAVLGLKAGQLVGGADIYRLDRVPKLDEFLPRGYTTLVDGLRLKPGFTQDPFGFRPGHGAWQIVLLKPVPATLVASLSYDQPFEPGLHPTLKARYGL